MEKLNGYKIDKRVKRLSWNHNKLGIRTGKDKEGNKFFSDGCIALKGDIPNKYHDVEPSIPFDMDRIKPDNIYNSDICKPVLIVKDYDMNKNSGRYSCVKDLHNIIILSDGTLIKENYVKWIYKIIGKHACLRPTGKDKAIAITTHADGFQGLVMPIRDDTLTEKARQFIKNNCTIGEVSESVSQLSA